MEEIIKEYILALLEQRRVSIDVEVFGDELAIAYEKADKKRRDEAKRKKIELDLIQKSKNFITKKYKWR